MSYAQLHTGVSAGAAVRLDNVRAARGGMAPWQKRKVDRYLRDNLEHPLHVGELVREVSLSNSQFFRVFKESFGITPHVHIVRLRLELAQRLMLSPETPLSHIALACGLADQAHFTRLFRRGVGETPGAWRRQHLIQGQTAPVRRVRAHKAPIAQGE
jgi:AraC family transcriptional regulator